MTEQQTPDREKKIAEIREALEKIDRGDLFEIAMTYEKSGEWLRFLLSELERLEHEYAEERAAHNEHVTELCQLEEKNRKLREERDKMIEGLRWYADAVNYEYRTSYLDQDAPIIDDNGQRARNILREIGGDGGMRVLFKCWSCGKEYDSETIPYQHGYKCDCGGYVISPSGKIQGRWEKDKNHGGTEFKLYGGFKYGEHYTNEILEGL